MYTLMVDPVILPTSKTTIDRSTIQSHLLSDPNDPFNRVPLRIEDVVPDADLIERIRLFKEDRKALKLQERSQCGQCCCWDCIRRCHGASGRWWEDGHFSGLNGYGVAGGRPVFPLRVDWKAYGAAQQGSGMAGARSIEITVRPSVVAFASQDQNHRRQQLERRSPV